MTIVNITKDNTADTTEAPIRVTQMYGDTVSCDFVAGLTYQGYLDQADITVAPGQVVTANGAPINDLSAVVDPNTVIVVVGKNTNGMHAHAEG